MSDSCARISPRWGRCGGWRLPGLAAGQLAANGGHVLVKLGGRGQVTGGDAVEHCLSNFVRQPESDR